MTDDQKRVHDLAVAYTHAKWITGGAEQYVSSTHPDQEISGFLETYEEVYSKILDIVEAVGFTRIE